MAFRGYIQFGLRLRAPRSHQNVGPDLRIQHPAELACQNLRLIVASPELSGPMQWYRYDHVNVLEQFRVFHEPAEHLRIIFSLGNVAEIFKSLWDSLVAIFAVIDEQSRCV